MRTRLDHPWLQGPMFRRLRPSLRAFAWLAFVAMGLAAFVPVVSQVLRPPAALVSGGCEGHMGRVHEGQPMPPDHGTAPMDACGYCAFMAHHPGLPTVPVVVMRPPALGPEVTPEAVPQRLTVAVPLLDAAPRGPPLA